MDSRGNGDRRPALIIGRADAVVIICIAAPARLEALGPVSGAYTARVAPDEILLLAAAADGPRVLADANAALRPSNDPDGALILDQTDAWAIVTLPDAAAVWLLARLSVIRFPTERPAFCQGMVAGLPAKVFFDGRATHLMVPRPVGHYLEARIREVGTAHGPCLFEDEPLRVSVRTVHA